MDTKEIRELIELISRSNFTSFELERNGFRIKLVKEESGAVAADAAGETPSGPLRLVEPVAAATAPSESKPDEGSEFHELNSPIVGTFYNAPSPDASPFVEVGSQVKRGQVLCIVEAMKVMNEIESELDAEIVEILVSAGQPVEYGEVLFRMRPLG